MVVADNMVVAVTDYTLGDVAENSLDQICLGSEVGWVALFHQLTFEMILGNVVDCKWLLFLDLNFGILQ